MGERKVLNKYYPPDIDFWKPPKLKLPKGRQYVVRIMAPFTMRCTTCGEYIHKGQKFNSRKETVTKEDYLGIPIYLFYINCPNCLGEITFKTDPKNSNYVVENNAVQTFQAAIKECEEKESNDLMLALENRTKESKREMDIINALEEIIDMNAQHQGVQQLIDKHLESERKEIEEEEEKDKALARAAFEREKNKLKRVSEEDFEEKASKRLKTTPTNTRKKKFAGLVKRKRDTIL